jgi:hypothetical protein
MREYAMVLTPILLALLVWGIWLLFRPFSATVRVGATLTVAGGIALFSLWKVPQWQVSYLTDTKPEMRFSLENEARKTLAQVVAGIAVLAGFYGTWQNLSLTQRSLAMSQEGQLTDRFTKAVEQLEAVDSSGNKKLQVRLGGIYALKGLANESQDLHWPIMEVLSAYVRANICEERCQKERIKTSRPLRRGEILLTPITVDADLVAAVAVLTTRDTRYELMNQRLDLSRTDLSQIHRFGDANFNNADLWNSDLSHVELHHAKLNGANLNGTTLKDTDFMDADLRGASFLEADLDSTNFSAAKLAGANLSGVDLSKSKGLTQEQIEHAYGDKETELPAGLHPPERWLTKR